LQLASTVPY